MIHIKKKIIMPLVALLSMVSIGCATMGLGQASTVRGKFFQARVEYAQLLILANEYKASPTADPVVVGKMQEIDLKVQEVENEILVLLAQGNITEASGKVQFLAVVIGELRSQLIARGVLKLEVE